MKRFRLVESGWADEITDAMQAGSSNLRLVSPFVKLRATERFLRPKQHRSIRLVTRFNLAEMYAGVNDISALRLLLEHGAAIRGVRNLHSKLYLFGGHRAIITSANLTEAALCRNHEFGFVTRESEIISECGEYFDRLWNKAGENLTAADLDGWEERIARYRLEGVRTQAPADLTDEGANLGFADAGSSPSAVSPLVAESAFVKFLGEGHNRAEWRLPVIQEVDRAGCHQVCAWPKGKRPRQVDDGAIIFLGRIVDNPRDIVIFGRAVGMRHKEGRDDATVAEIRRRDWKARWPHYVRLHHPEFVAGTLSNGVSLYTLMDELGANAFASTKRNATRGTGNLSPRKSLRQQPAVQLSPEGLQWVHARFERALQTYGRLEQAALVSLE